MSDLALPSIPEASLRLWKVEQQHAHHYPFGTEYGGLIRTPDGQLWGVHARVVEVEGRKHFEGGLFPVDRYPPPDRAYIAKQIAAGGHGFEEYAVPIPVPPRNRSRPDAGGSPSGHFPAKLTGKPLESADSEVQEGLPL